jgi:hypothetical protein
MSLCKAGFTIDQYDYKSKLLICFMQRCFLLNVTKFGIKVYTVNEIVNLRPYGNLAL